MDVVLLCVFGILALFLLSALAQAIRIVPEYQRLVVMRFGRVIGERGPGLVFLIPFIDKAITVDLRERVREVPHQTCITKDNAAIAVDFVWYYKVVDPVMSVVQVENFEESAGNMATTTLRAVIGGILLDDVLSQREYINNMLRTRLDEVTERWGVKVTNVEIREIVPPREIQEAMNRQMSAERNRRALVTESLGKKEAAINVAEGEKQASILRAEGEKQAAILRAEGFALALSKIFDVAKEIDEKTLTLQYFDTLKALGQGQSSKIIFPMEFTEMLKAFQRLRGEAKTQEQGDGVSEGSETT
ncbi:MAG: SPFH/Band 7/PHB domain protein [Chloroflexi bacterium]|nr:SPFH/Band 7/PHB domain protein [Chloroflexota bacterium]